MGGGAVAGGAVGGGIGAVVVAGAEVGGATVGATAVVEVDEVVEAGSRSGVVAVVPGRSIGATSPPPSSVAHATTSHVAKVARRTSTPAVAARRTGGMAARCPVHG